MSNSNQPTSSDAGHIGVFVSYAHEDKPLAIALREGLVDAGLEVWIDEGALRTGDSMIQSIATAIHEMEYVVADTPSAVVSKWCQYEINTAMTSGLNREGVKLLPVRVAGAPIPKTLVDTYCLPPD
jgi:hypothetical protein